MLTIVVPPQEYFNEETNEFQLTKEVTLQLEHSLLSLSKWESKWKKPFLSTEKTVEESLDYIKHMTITHNIPDDIYYRINSEMVQTITDYINDKMTATTISNNTNSGSHRIRGEVITAEVLYYWMIALNIPIEFQKWHLNKLLTLVQVCSIKQGPQKKMSKREIMQQNHSINAARRARMNSKG